MKKLVIAALAALTAVSLTACGSKETTTTTSAKSDRVVIYTAAEDERIAPLDALTEFYASDTYRRLEEESTKLWHYGPVALYEEYLIRH